MRTIKSLLAVLAGGLVLVSVSVNAAENPWEKKLPFKAATVTYTVKGTMTGDKTVYIKDYGRTTAEYSTMTMKMFGMTQKQKEVIITTPDWVYTADLTEGTGTKHANIRKYMLEEYNSLSKSDQEKVVKNAEAMGVSTIEGMDGSLEKNAATIMGYSCDRVTAMGTTAYTISGSDLPLKVEGDTMGMKIQEHATDIKKGEPPASKFEPTKGINFTHDVQTDQMMKTQAQAAIQNLLQGKRPVAGTAAQAGGYSQPSPSPSSAQTPSYSQGNNQAGQVIRDDANDVGQAAHEEAKDATIDEVREGVQKAFKSLFD